MSWRKQCEMRDGDTGRRCCLLAGHAEVHRNVRGAFATLAQPGQTDFARDKRIEEGLRPRMTSSPEVVL